MRGKAPGKDTKNMENISKKVMDRIRKIQKNRADELGEVKNKKDAAEKQLEEARQALKDATQRTDLKAYESAQLAKDKAQTACNMYGDRYNQLVQMDLISEEESDKVFDSLLAYEDELGKAFLKDISDPLEKLKTIHRDYVSAIAEAEHAMDSWHNEIHPNYNTRGTMSRVDPETGLITDRSKHPVPVHILPFVGCPESVELGKFLATVEAAYGASKE